jgi:hypothetical protein
LTQADEDEEGEQFGPAHRRITELKYTKQGRLDKSLLTSSQLRLIKFFRERPVVSEACKMAKVSRDTHYRWQKENRIYQELIARATEESTDTARGKLWDKVSRGDLQAVKYYLEHNAAEYAQNLQVTHSMSPSWYERQAGPSIKNMGVAVTTDKQHVLLKAIDREDVEVTNEILFNAALKKQTEDAQQSGSSEDSELQAEAIPMGGTQ